MSLMEKYHLIEGIGLDFPGVEAGTCYRTPALRVRNHLLTRLHDNGTDLILKMPNVVERNLLLEAEPDTFHITEDFRDYPYVLVRLAKIDPALFAELFEEIWRQNASKQLISDYEAR